MKMVTTRQALELLKGEGVSVSYPTVAQWVREGRFKGAEREETERGPVWRIPLESVKSFEPPKLGRPRGDSEKAATGRASAGNGRSTSKKRGKR